MASTTTTIVDHTGWAARKARFSTALTSAGATVPTRATVFPARSPVRLGHRCLPAGSAHRRVPAGRQVVAVDDDPTERYERHGDQLQVRERQRDPDDRDRQRDRRRDVPEREPPPGDDDP